MQEVPWKKIQETVTIGIRLEAPDAHQQAIEAVTEEKSAGTKLVFVWSETEGQYIGAIYERGQTYEGWTDAVADELPATASVPEGEPRPLSGVGTAGRVRGAQVTVLKPEAEWPKSPASRLILTHVQAHGPCTAQAIEEAIGEDLKEIGTDFPRAAVSRLKQAGFLG